MGPGLYDVAALKSTKYQNKDWIYKSQTSRIVYPTEETPRHEYSKVQNWSEAINQKLPYQKESYDLRDRRSEVVDLKKSIEIPGPT